MPLDNVQKRKESLFMEIAPEIDHIRKHHVTMTEKKRLKLTKCS